MKSPPVTKHKRLRYLGILVLAVAGGVCIAFWIWNLGPESPEEKPESVSKQVLAASGTLPIDAPAWQEIDSPTQDGWSIEVLSEEAQRVLQELGPFVFGRQAISAVKLTKFCAADYVGDALQPRPLQLAFHDDLLRVSRWKPNDSSVAAGRFQGISGFQESINSVAKSWSMLDDVRFHFKIFRAIESSADLETHQFVSASGKSKNGHWMEQHATWVIHWRADSKRLAIRSIHVIELEETSYESKQKLFSDCSSILSKNDSYRSQLLLGMNYWLDRNQDRRYFSPLGNPGLAIGDVNGDGLDDLYVCQEANLPNRLFLQQPDGAALDVSAAWKVDWLEGSRSAVLVDFDNDGDQDLAVALLGGVLLASNEGNSFKVRDVLATDDDTSSMTAADYDLDGDLDLYVCVDYPNDYFASPAEFVVQGGAANRVYHDANQAGRNSLFRNEISEEAWNFVDATEDTGLNRNNQRFSWASCWEDYDNDGDQDLYVANDFGRNNLYTNENGKFTDLAKRANVEDSASGMSAAWADFNRDGQMDLYVANMFSSAGSRITYQPEFKSNASIEIRDRLRRFARGSTLFQNLGGQFRDVSLESGVMIGRWAWSSNFVDVNNDGWKDIVVANGYITSDNTSDL